MTHRDSKGRRSGVKRKMNKRYDLEKNIDKYFPMIPENEVCDKVSHLMTFEINEHGRNTL